MTDMVGSKGLVARVQAILTSPKTEWPIIAAEPASVGGLYTGYILILAAVPAIAGFLSASIIGYNLPIVGFVRTPMAAGLTSALIGYVFSLIGVFIIALIADALAPTFGGTKNQVQALKAVAYAYTAAWVAGAATIVPFVGWLIAIAGGIYSIYLLYLGLPATMHSPVDRAIPYTAVVIVCGIVVTLVLGMVIGLAGLGAGMGMMSNTGQFGANSGTETQFDPESPMGQLEQWANRMEQAGQNLESAQQSGDPAAQQDALSTFLGTALGNDGSVESLPTEQMEGFAPTALAGMSRTEITSERNQFLGLQMSQTRATYTNNAGNTLDLEIMDMGGASGLTSLASWAGVEESTRTATGYERTYRQDGRMIREAWDNQSRFGEYGVIVGDRFLVQVTGEADSIDTLKTAVASVDLAALERAAQ